MVDQHELLVTTVFFTWFIMAFFVTGTAGRLYTEFKRASRCAQCLFLFLTLNFAVYGVGVATYEVTDEPAALVAMNRYIYLTAVAMVMFALNNVYTFMNAK